MRSDSDFSILGLHGTRLATLRTQLGVLNSTMQTEGVETSRYTELRSILTTRVDQELQLLVNVRASIEGHVAESHRIYNESIRVGADQGKLPSDFHHTALIPYSTSQICRIKKLHWLMVLYSSDKRIPTTKRTTNCCRTVWHQHICYHSCTSSTSPSRWRRSTPCQPSDFAVWLHSSWCGHTVCD